MFIVDDHLSHINMKFIPYCDQIGILLIILFLYFMHCLQFFDVVFFLYIITYSNQIDTLIQSSCGFMCIIKHVF